MGNGSRQRKLRWFRAGARHLAATWPTLPLPDETLRGAVYACPLCAVLEPKGIKMRMFQESHLRDGLLTADHVPPRHSQGRHLVLTCKECNDTAGYTVDAAAFQVERGLAFLSGQAPGDVKIRTGVHTLRAVLTMNESGGGSFEVLPGAPKIINSFQEELSDIRSAERTLHVTYQIRDPNDAVARTSWLKSAYLAMFALYGYGYAFHPALERVRLQIRHPEANHIPMFSVRLPIPIPFDECRVFAVDTPELPPCWGIQMGPYVVFLPGDSSESLYGRLLELRDKKSPLSLTAQNCVWPSEPLFGLAPKEQRG